MTKMSKQDADLSNELMDALDAAPNGVHVLAPRGLNDSPIGRRVVAWNGERRGQHGAVARVDTPYFAFVRWDADGETTHYRSAWLTRPHFVAPQD